MGLPVKGSKPLLARVSDSLFCSTFRMALSLSRGVCAGVRVWSGLGLGFHHPQGVCSLMLVQAASYSDFCVLTTPNFCIQVCSPSLEDLPRAGSRLTRLPSFQITPLELLLCLCPSVFLTVCLSCALFLCTLPSFPHILYFVFFSFFL